MFLHPGVRWISLFLLVFGVFAPRALGQFASCKPGWEWANNTKQQNPCEVAGALDAQCEGFASYILGPLSPGSNYVAPQQNDSLGQKCNCNTVIFSLYMACTACQNVTTQPWTFWSQFCDQVYVTQYPDIIPSDTAVPRWAYLNYTVGNKFDPVAAEVVGGLPEAVAQVPSTISLLSTSTSSNQPSLITVVPISTSTNLGGDNGRNRSSNANVGAIAGGVIGGFAALAAIVVGVWIFLRKRATTYGYEGFSEPSGLYTGAPTHDNETRPSSTRLYDPSDPLTYPGSYTPSGPFTTASHHGHYTGAAEV